MGYRGINMWKAISAFFICLVLLVCISVVVGQRTSPSQERAISSVSGASSSFQGETEYKNIKLSFSSFDLVAGLTQEELEAIPLRNTYFFAFLWACSGFSWFLIKPKRCKW
jgi:hypothetical protein